MLSAVTRLRIVQPALLGAVCLVVAWGCAQTGSVNGTISGDRVVTWRVPEGGSLPQAVVDDTGMVHLVYFQGEAREGDLMYVTRTPSTATWSEPVRVNSEQGSVTGIGPIDGGHLALGKDNRLHVTWFRLNTVDFFYTRTNEEGPGFEPQFGVGGGFYAEAAPSLAADTAGNVFMFWHEGLGEDAGRAVYITVSHDDGLIWEPTRAVNAETEGACNCCNLRALSDETGTLYLSYRGARDNIHRGQRLLTSRDGGLTFSDQLIQPWEFGACPVSTTALSQGPAGVTVAWKPRVRSISLARVTWRLACRLRVPPRPAERIPPWRRMTKAKRSSPGAMAPVSGRAEPSTGSCSTRRTSRLASRPVAPRRSRTEAWRSRLPNLTGPLS